MRLSGAENCQAEIQIGRHLLCECVLERTLAWPWRSFFFVLCCCDNLRWSFRTISLIFSRNDHQLTLLFLSSFQNLVQNQQHHHQNKEDVDGGEEDFSTAVTVWRFWRWGNLRDLVVVVHILAKRKSFDPDKLVTANECFLKIFKGDAAQHNKSSRLTAL